jgi:parallel beta-helix repeat protein
MNGEGSQMSRMKRANLAAGLAAAALLILAIPASATTRTVSPGQSIQAALDLSSPGDTVLVKKGTYHEYLQIADKDRITLKGQKGSVLKQPAVVTPNMCTSKGEIAGVCVFGRVMRPPVPGPPLVVRQAQSDRITGLKISGFDNEGVFLFATNRARVDHTVLSDNGVYGAYISTSTRTRLDFNKVKGNKGQAGLFVEGSQNAHATVTRNKVSNNRGSGILLRDVQHGVTSRNRVSGSCIGISIFADSPGPAGHWKISRNRLTKNNRGCKATTGKGASPAFSGIGIALFGANHTVVSRNVVHAHRRKHPSAVYGGIVVVRANIKGGTAPKKDLISRNRTTGNRPDVNWDKRGSVKFSRNICHSSKPTRVCRSSSRRRSRAGPRSRRGSS